MPPWKPELHILGTYKVHADTALVRETNALDVRKRELELASTPIGYQPASDEARDPSLYECMMSAVLIELTLSDTDLRYSASDFGQPDSEQAAYMLKYLSDSGETVVCDDQFGLPPGGAIRLAFFLHFFDQTKPLQTSYGAVSVPPPVEMPERLRRLFHYEIPT
jgi:hypothetical protein